MAPKPGGLVVTVSPSSSAYFAGEVFDATITFTNSHPAASSPSAGPPPPPTSSGHARTASTVTPQSWNSRSGPQGIRNRPPNASHLGLAEYATGHLHSDEVPPSPFFGSTSGQFQPLASTSNGALPSPNGSPRRPQFGTSLSHTSPSSTPNRSVSTATNLNVSTSRDGVPTRKGLIGKSMPPSAPVPLAARLGGGLYSGGPRRPGAFARGGHGRAQSMAASSPDLLAGRNFSNEGSEGPGSRNPSGGHVKSRFGGSVVSDEFRKLSGPLRSTSTAIAEEEQDSPVESTTPNHYEDAAFPISSSSSSPAPPSFPRRPTFGHQRVPSSSLYNLSRAGLSTLSLADSDESDYDPNDDSQTMPPNGFYGIGRNDTMDSVVHDSLNASYSSASRTGPLFQDSMRPGPDLGLSSSNGLKPPPPPAILHPPNTISILWAFAHLEGSFEVDDQLIKPSEFLEVKQLLAGGVGGVGVGGGTLEERKKESGGWRSWLWGGDASPKPPAATGGVRSGVAQESEAGAGGGGATLEERKEKAVKDKEVPIFSCPPSILGVDLVVAPGESKSFSFSIRLPADLPPSFRGKAIKFNYQLVVGSNRAFLGPSSASRRGVASGKGSVSRVMRVPLRVYNHVGVTGARPFYDLTNPVIYQRDEAMICPVESPDSHLVSTKRKPRPSPSGRSEFETYAMDLLSSVALSPEIVQRPFSARNGPRSILDAPPSMRPEMSNHRGEAAFGIDLDEGAGCKAAVEIVSRNSQKVSYDINKDGYMVAQLTLVKSAYRLGETVNGSVVVNSGEGRVLKVSARLETHELVETTISTRPAPQIRQLTRRLHSEHHETTLDSARLGFALAIPSGATPDFGTSGVKLQWSVRMSFLVIPPSPDAPVGGSSPPVTPRRNPLGRAPPPPPPAPAPPNNRGGHHGRSKSFAYGFEPAVPLTLPPPPSIAPSGAAHLMPVPPPTPSTAISSFEPPKPIQYTTYRAVPDLGFVPVLFSSSLPDPPPSPGPLQKTAAGAMHRPNAPSMSLSASQRDPLGGGRTVLVPAKVETVECSIPIKVYPGNTPFKPTVTIFDA
ncbi:hypothetical protein JCM10212_001828 [Sporobolomyces blumeae]